MNKQELYELKMKLITMINNPEYIASIVTSLESDKEKLDWLYRTRNPKGKAIIIASLGVSDDEKLKLLSMLISPKDKAIVIASLQSDDRKIELLDTIKSNTEYAQARVIESLKSDDAKIACLSHIDNVRVRAKIIASLASDEKKAELIGTVQDEYERLPALIIMSVKSRDIQKRLIENLANQNIKRELRERIEEEELEGKSEEEIVRYIREQRARSRQGGLIARLIKREELQYEMFKECRIRGGSEEHTRSLYYLQSVGLLGKTDNEKIAHIVQIANTPQKCHIPEVLERLSGDGLKIIITQYPEIYKACIERSGPIQLADMAKQVISIEPERNPLGDMSIEELQGLGDKLQQEIDTIRGQLDGSTGTKRQRLITTIEGQRKELAILKKELAGVEAQVQEERGKKGITK